MNIQDIISRLDRKLHIYKRKMNELLPDTKSLARLDFAESMVAQVLGTEVFQAMLVKHSCEEVEHIINLIKQWRRQEATGGLKANARSKERVER